MRKVFFTVNDSFQYEKKNKTKLRSCEPRRQQDGYIKHPGSFKLISPQCSKTLELNDPRVQKPSISLVCKSQNPVFHLTAQNFQHKKRTGLDGFTFSSDEIAKNKNIDTNFSSEACILLAHSSSRPSIRPFHSAVTRCTAKSLMPCCKDLHITQKTKCLLSLL